MWKFGLFTLSVLGAVAGFTNGAKLGRLGTTDPSQPVDVAQLFKEEAERANKKKGSVNGHSTFVGAEARGNRLSYQYEVNLSPRSVNTVAAKDEFYRKAVPMVCKEGTAFRKAVMQGASIEYAYRTATTKQYLFEINLNAASCRV